MRGCGTRVAVCVWCVLVWATPADSQIDNRINMSNPPGTGRIHDANPQVGSGGRNSARPGFLLGLRANAIVTGNVTGLGVFHGDSPVLQNNRFRAELPSTGLTDFRRRSASVSDARSGGLPPPRFYFDPTRTIADVGQIRRGLNLPGSSVLSSSGITPLSVLRSPTARSTSPARTSPIDLRVGVSGSNTPRLGVVQRRVTRLDAGRPFSGIVSPFEQAVDSSIFGPRLPNDPDPFANLPAERPVTLGLLRPGSRTNAASLPDLSRLRPWDVGRRRPSGDTTSDGRVSPGGRSVVGTGMPGVVSSPMAQDAPGPLIGVGAPEGLGNDRYTDMRRAVAAARRSGGRVSGDHPTAMFPEGRLEPRPADGSQVGDAGAADEAAGPVVSLAARSTRFSAENVRRLATVSSWATDLLENPVKTFAGRHRNALNEHLAGGEADMLRGDFYRAVRQFQIAHTIDPKNPLPLLARGHALAAAADYVSAVRSLVMGIELFPDISAFRLDLPAMVGQRDVFDRRRADLDSRLRRGEDRELRFLLGYLEFYSGLREPGLRDLAKAAAAAPPGHVIADFPNRLDPQPAPEQPRRP